MRTGSSATRSLQRGLTYIGLLLFIAISGIGLAAVGQVWQAESQREREKELLFVGEQYARAIASYYDSTPGGARQYPARLKELLQDDRFPVVKRHLRKMFPDPMTGSSDWGLIKEQGRIVGVYSLSERSPLKRQGFTESWIGFDKAERYSEWRFSLVNAAQPSLGESSPGAAGSRLTAATGQMPQGARGPEALPGAGKASAEVSASSASAKQENQPKRSEGYAACQSEWTAGNAQCRATCGGGAACTNCFAQTFAQYRACLRGG